MKPADLRNANWAEIQPYITGQRKQVYEAWLRFGPATTARIADFSKISLLSLRPRTTELFQIGLVEFMGRDSDSNEGIYRAVPVEQAEAAYEAHRRANSPQAHQLPLQLS